MEDLTGLDWTASQPVSSTQKPPPMNPVSYYPSLRPTPPLSGRSTPSSIKPSETGFKPPQNLSSRSNNATPAPDSFANLVAFSPPQSTSSGSSLKNLSLQEQQKLLQEKREKKEHLRKNQLGTGFGARDGEFLDNLGNGRVIPSRVAAPPSYTGTDEYGGQKLSSAINKPFAAIGEASHQQSLKNYGSLLSAFNSASPLRPSSSGGILPPNIKSDRIKEKNGSKNGELADIDDDPFGLGSIEGRTASQKIGSQPAGDDDILGLLGRPVSEFSPPERDHSSTEVVNRDRINSTDHAMAELMDMGFSAERSKEALDATESGTDVQAAVGWLLNQAHDDSHRRSRSQIKQKAEHAEPRSTRLRSSRNSQSPGSRDIEPAWLREQNSSKSTQRRQDSRSPVNGDRDPGKYAAELGTNLFKTANSLWKSGAKKLNQAVSELNSDSDSSQPKWMREVQDGDGNRPKHHKTHVMKFNDEEQLKKTLQRSSSNEAPGVTDEALMLESGGGRQPAKSSRQQRSKPATVTMDSFEDQSFDTYVSPARRKKTTPQLPSRPTSKPPPPDVDLIFDAENFSKPKPPTSRAKASAQTEPSTQSSASIQASTPPRSIPQISPSALQSSTTHRHEGTAAFKRGDYALAVTRYTSALSTLPPTHPISIVILTNRALAQLKTGEPKSSIEDCASAISLIGPSRGALEIIDLGGTEGAKDMKTFWTKAMTRRAEGLEQLERWSEAAAIWQSCVEAGAGGAPSIEGRNRCDRAISSSSGTSQATKPAPSKKPPSKSVPKSSALDDLSNHPKSFSSSLNPGTESAEAVIRLRKANAAAERLDDEKFALADQVSERLTRWRAGKEGNLRALLASLETVLWEGAGWRKVGMGELIVPGKVKVVYMRGIAKVHPDKLPPTATTEQGMVSAAVFATLNEAWDGFKRENGL